MICHFILCNFLTNQTADMDPFLDDSVTMAKRLKLLGKSVGLDVLPGLPHGFLNFVKVTFVMSTSTPKNQVNDKIGFSTIMEKLMSLIVSSHLNH